MESHLQAGIAIYNDGEYHAAHDAWEDHWLNLESGTDDELFLHGLIQFTAAVFHAHNRNWSGATGLADSAVEYLRGLPADYRDVNIGDVRTYLRTLARDPEYIERQHPLQLRYGGEVLEPAVLDLPATCLAAAILAAEHGYDESVINGAIEFARSDAGSDEGDEIVALVFDFVREPDKRGIIDQRLGEHVRRRQRREGDVESLFDASE